MVKIRAHVKVRILPGMSESPHSRQNDHLAGNFWSPGQRQPSESRSHDSGQSCQGQAEKNIRFSVTKTVEYESSRSSVSRARRDSPNQAVSCEYLDFQKVDRLFPGFGHTDV